MNQHTPIQAPTAQGGAACAQSAWAGRWLFWYAALTPLWWATGLLDPLGMVTIVVLYAARPRRTGGAETIPRLWFAAGAAQYLSTVLNWTGTGQTWGDLAHMLLSLATSGWILIGMSIAIGASYRLDGPALARAVCVKSGWVLLFSIVSLVLFAGLGVHQLELPSLVGLLHLIPSAGTSDDFHFSMRFFTEDNFEGGSEFRLQLFYPWPTALGIAGVLPILLARRERSWKWRVIGMLGGIAAVVLSFSRAVFVALALILAAAGFLRMGTRMRAGVILVVAAALNVAVLLGLLDPLDIFEKIHDAFTQARAGSSEARDMLYDAAWQGFLSEPWIGHGWFGPLYARWMPIPIGSHSVLYGVLYRGGIVTFATVCFAYLATCWSCLVRWHAGSPGAAPALALLFLFGLVAYGENLETLAVPLLFAFAWIGGELAPLLPAARPATPALRAGVRGSEGQFA